MSSHKLIIYYIYKKMKYEEPSWKTTCDVAGFDLEMVKSGEIVNVTKLIDQSCFVIGRARAVDVALENPTVSDFMWSCSLMEEIIIGNCTILEVARNVFEQKRVGENLRHDSDRFNVQTWMQFEVFVLNGSSQLMPPEYDSENLRDLRSKKFVVEKKKAAPCRKIVKVNRKTRMRIMVTMRTKSWTRQCESENEWTKRIVKTFWNRKKLEVDLKRLVDLDRSTRRG